MSKTRTRVDECLGGFLYEKKAHKKTTVIAKDRDFGDIRDIHGDMAECDQEECPTMVSMSSSCIAPSQDQSSDRLFDLKVDSVPAYTSKKKAEQRPIFVDTVPTLPADPEDLETIRQTLVLERMNDKVYITATAFNKKNPDKNSIQSISARGESFGGYGYDTVCDSFFVNCVEYVPLGTIPVSFRLSVPGFPAKYALPLTESLIEKYLIPTQKKTLQALKEKHPECIIVFVQSLSRG
jgi:hypothetical protein